MFKSRKDTPRGEAMVSLRGDIIPDDESLSLLGDSGTDVISFLVVGGVVFLFLGDRAVGDKVKVLGLDDESVNSSERE